MTNIPRSEYPRPQIVRDKWICLNGEWDFEIDNSRSGREKKFQERKALDGKIIVPFCPESELSGVGHKDFMECVWYRRDLDIPKEWRNEDTRIILHFGAVDYAAAVYVNGKYTGRKRTRFNHKGGYTPFSVDITDYLQDEGNYVTVCAVDETRSGNQPTGKQSHQLYSYSCLYTRTTGIWQTVWMEPVHKIHVKNIKATPDVATTSVGLEVKMSDNALGAVVEAVAYFDGRQVGHAKTEVNSASAFLNIALSEKHLWDVGQGNLYDLKVTVTYGGKVVDKVDSYFGLRSVALCGKAFVLNGRKVFGRWVLDQGFYPDGIYTAPTDEALKNDIIYAMQLGFNGARLHQKIFEPRFLYHADKLGYLVWGEHANWGLDISTFASVEHFLPEWLESIERDYSHPSIIGWCPFNETWDTNHKRQYNPVLEVVYKATKAVDSTRPVIDTSGNFHVITDIYDVHDYDQNVESFAKKYNNGPNLPEHFTDRQVWNGEPYFMSEYGGIAWNPNQKEGWGYGQAPTSEEEFIQRYKGLTEALLQNENILGFCYTQLYDVEIELNGLMTYERKFKFDPKIFYDINTQKAAIED